ncbi:MAG TPA: prolipoprotein diacylglyceryl transferase family protein, partial [Gemmatimonadales bacterium]
MTVYPWILHFGFIDITGYGLMMMVGFLTGSWLIQLELRRRKLREEYASDITLAAVIGGVVGAKLWYVVLMQDPGALFSRGGLVWYGGFLGGTLAVILNGIRLRVPTAFTAHLVAPALAAAYALGRIGCFLVNDDYGRPTTLPWGMKFPQGMPPSTVANLRSQFGLDLPADMDPSTVLAVHPTQLYEVALMLAAF